MTGVASLSSYRKKLIEVGSAVGGHQCRIGSGRNPFGMGTHLRCICGGRGGRSQRAGRCCSRRWWMTRTVIHQYRTRPDGSVYEDAAGRKRADLFNFIEELVMWENSNNPDVIRTARAEIARCVASRLIESGALKKAAIIGARTTASDLVRLGHCRPISRWAWTAKVGRVRFSFDVSGIPPSAEVVNGFLEKHAPQVFDPFAGGGSRFLSKLSASDCVRTPVISTRSLY